MITSSGVLRATIAAIVVASVALSNVGLAAAATEPVTGTATTTGGDGAATFQDFSYASSGVLGTGTIHLDFTLIFGNPVTTVGTGVVTRSDGATLTTTEASTVDLSTFPYPVEIHLVVTSGTGALEGVTGEIVLVGVSHGPGSTGDTYTMTGTLETPSGSTPTSGRPVVQACIGATFSDAAHALPPGELGAVVSDFAHDGGLGAGIQAIKAGEIPDSAVVNACN